jgi:hypothetical protein
LSSIVRLGFLATKRAPKGPIQGKTLSDEPFRVLNCNLCLSKYASQKRKGYWGIEAETEKYIYI